MYFNFKSFDGMLSEPKIVGGFETNIGEFPHQVALYNNQMFICGGAIINTLLILTAAHCFRNKQLNHNNLKVVAGLQDRSLIGTGKYEQARTAKIIYVHENYYRTKSNEDINDIAIILLSAPFQYTLHVRNISLPRKNEDFEGDGLVSGWGSKKEQQATSAVLMKVTVPIVSLETCRKGYGEKNITEDMLCMGETGRDSCQGDSGGAALCWRDIWTPPVICGIVSFGRGCGRAGLPGIYTRVSKYIDWIENAEKKIFARGKCQTDHFYCFSDQKCIPRTFLCDKGRDCWIDGEDEHGCTKTTSCLSNHFRCKNGNCIKKEYICNNYNDCGDRSDEDTCPNAAKICVDGEHQCGVGGRCIPVDWKCDGWQDCDDNSDESDCSMQSAYVTGPCFKDLFYCSKDSRCIPMSWRCDGERDCASGMDEMGCVVTKTTTRRPLPTTASTLTAPCALDQFFCSAENRCIPQRYRCDGDRDCVSGTDEIGCPGYNFYVTSASTTTTRRPTTRTSSTTPMHTHSIPTTTRTRRPATATRTSTSTTHRSTIPTTPLPTTATALNPCDKDHFYCSEENRCIPQRYRCDGDRDCVSGIDEIGCRGYNSFVPLSTTTTSKPTISTTTRTKRPTKRMISLSAAHRSTIPTTPPKPTTAANPCIVNELYCSEENRCIPERYRCDGDRDCVSGIDEIGCPGYNSYVTPATTTTR